MKSRRFFILYKAKATQVMPPKCKRIILRNYPRLCFESQKRNNKFIAHLVCNSKLSKNLIPSKNVYSPAFCYNSRREIFFGNSLRIIYLCFYLFFNAYLQRNKGKISFYQMSEGSKHNFDDEFEWKYIYKIGNQRKFDFLENIGKKKK